MPYKPMHYGSAEYRALRRSVVTTRTRATIGKRVVIVEQHRADAPGLWIYDSAELWEICIKAPALVGLSNHVTENIATAATREEALAKAAERLAQKK